MAHCLNPLYISNSHCDQRTKARHIRVLLWTLDAGAARQKQSFWLCGTKRQRSFVLWSTATLGTFCLSHTQVTLPWPLLQTLWLGIVIAADLDQLVKINGGQRWIFSHGRDAPWLSITRGKKKISHYSSLLCGILVWVSSALWKAAAFSLDWIAAFSPQILPPPCNCTELKI